MNLISSPRWPPVWYQLAVMIDAGMSIEKALHTLINAQESNRTPAKINIVLKRVHGLVQRGTSLASSLERAKAMSVFDVSLLRTAEQAGRVEDGLKAISQRRLRQLQRVDTLRTLLWLPQCILLIGCIAAVFIRAVRGEDAVYVIFNIAVIAITVRIVTLLLLNLLRVEPRYYLSKLWSITRLKQTSPLFQLSFESVYYSALVWQLRAGVDVQQATLNCQNLLAYMAFQHSVRNAARAMGRGESAGQCLNDAGLVLSNRLRMALSVGEQAGRWEHAISHELSLQAEIITQKLDANFKWLPRAYYLIVLVLISSLLV